MTPEGSYEFPETMDHVRAATGRPGFILQHVVDAFALPSATPRRSAFLPAERALHNVRLNAERDWKLEETRKQRQIRRQQAA
jgi:hypothetical protein